MRKFFLWSGGVLVFLFVGISYLIFFYPDQKLEPFDDLEVNLPNITDEQNGYKYLLEAYEAFTLPDGVRSSSSEELKEFFNSGKLEDIKELPDFYPLLKINSKALKAFDKANEFDYFIPDMNLGGKDFSALVSIGLDVYDSFDPDRLLILRILYKLQQGNQDGALKSIFDTMKFQNKRALFPRSPMELLIDESFFDNSLYILRLILNDSYLNHDGYVGILDFLNNLEPNFVDGWNNALKFEFHVGVKTREAISKEVDIEGMNINRFDYLSESKFHFQPNRTNNMFAGYYRKMVTDPFYSPEEDMLQWYGKYKNKKLLLFIMPNSYGEILLASFMPSLSGCKPFSVNFDLYSLRLLVAIKLYELQNDEAPENLEDLVPGYFKDLNWLDFNDERIIDYSSKNRVLYSDFLQKNCRMDKKVDLIK